MHERKIKTILKIVFSKNETLGKAAEKVWEITKRDRNTGVSFGKIYNSDVEYTPLDEENRRRYSDDDDDDSSSDNGMMMTMIQVMTMEMMMTTIQVMTMEMMMTTIQVMTMEMMMMTIQVMTMEMMMTTIQVIRKKTPKKIPLRSRKPLANIWEGVFLHKISKN